MSSLQLFDLTRKPSDSLSPKIPETFTAPPPPPQARPQPPKQLGSEATTVLRYLVLPEVSSESVAPEPQRHTEIQKGYLRPQVTDLLIYSDFISPRGKNQEAGIIW